MKPALSLLVLLVISHTTSAGWDDYVTPDTKTWTIVDMFRLGAKVINADKEHVWFYFDVLDDSDDRVYVCTYDITRLDEQTTRCRQIR